MTALRKTLIEEEPEVTERVARAPAIKLYVVAPEATAVEEAGHALTNILLFFAAPFVGLVYVIAFPFVGLAALTVIGGRALAKMEPVRVIGLVLKHVGFMVAAPVLGLAYAVFFPFIGLAALTWIGGRAAVAAVTR